VQPSADDFVLHFAPQSRSVTQASAGFFAQVPSPVAGSTTHVSVGKRQRTNPGLPHVERAAQLTTLPLQFPGTVPSATSDFTTCATQLTKRPWLLASSQDGHRAMIAAWAAQRAGSQSVFARAGTTTHTSTMAAAATNRFMAFLPVVIPSGSFDAPAVLRSRLVVAREAVKAKK
jgi:hypothetical protein